MSKLETLTGFRLHLTGNPPAGTRRRLDRPARQHARLAAWLRRLPFGLLLVVALPTLATAIYYEAIAADQYVSEAKFVVRSAVRQAPTGLGSFLGTVGLTHTSDDAYPVNDFIASRDAVRLLEHDQDLRGMLDRPEADPLARYPNLLYGPSFEHLYQKYKHVVSVSLDTSSSITTLTTRAFRPEDARTLAIALLADAEALINRMNERARRDAITQAQSDVDRAEQRVTAVQQALTRYRTQQNMIDPAKASAGLLDLVARLAGESAQTKAQLSQLQRSAPSSPQIPTLQTRIAALEQQVTQERGKIVGGDSSIASTLGEYERLLLEREFADKTLSSAIASLEAARTEAQRQQLYLERVVEPNLADYATYPRRLMSVGTVLLGSLIAYGIGWLLLAGVREHVA